MGQVRTPAADSIAGIFRLQALILDDVTAIGGTDISAILDRRQIRGAILMRLGSAAYLLAHSPTRTDLCCPSRCRGGKVPAATLMGCQDCGLP